MPDQSNDDKSKMKALPVISVIIFCISFWALSSRMNTFPALALSVVIEFIAVGLMYLFCNWTQSRE